ncbi:hypothetical protein BJ944DRAFT_171824 [Cunninghamella echinulata]|nr:hypothetical protein BJ944DRAFT_171824 [Cunninghamella echinulata]
MTKSHQQILDNGMALFKKYTSSLDGWQLTSEKNGVKLYSRKPDNPNEPVLVRGECEYTEAKDVRPVDLSTCAIFPSARRVWDSRFEDSEVRMIRSRYSYICYARSKPNWPVKPRDFSTITYREVTEDATYLGIFSIEDETLIPQVEGYVRATILCSGWKFAKNENGKGLKLTYISQIDFKGTVPPVIVKAVMQQIPLCAYRVKQYHEKYGFPPTTTNITAHFLGEEFQHEKATYVLKLDKHPSNSQSKNTADILCCRDMFSKGLDIAIHGDADYDVVDQGIHKLVRIFNVQALTTVYIVGKKKNK